MIMVAMLGTRFLRIESHCIECRFANYGSSALLSLSFKEYEPMAQQPGYDLAQKYFGVTWLRAENESIDAAATDDEVSSY
jgi:hypothetical protein